MTVKDLYAMCDNLNQETLFTIRAGYLERAIEIDIPYLELAYYWEMHIRGFRVDGKMYCTIYI